jgi:hypothetical protein
MTMDATTLRHLADLFAAEVDGRIAIVTPKRDAKRMIQEGLIDLAVMRRRDALGSYEITQHVLTHRGRYLYCDHASKEIAAALGEP